MVEFVKTCDQYPRKFKFGHIFSGITLPLLLYEKMIFRKRCLGEMSNFLPPRGRVLFEVMSKYEQIQLFDSQMYLPVILIS